MLNIRISDNLKEVTQHMNRLQKKQIPYAAMQALNDTAFDARKASRVQIEKKLDRPTKFTVNAFQVIKSTKVSQTAVIYIHPTRWDYLKYQIEGGSRKTSGKGTGVPVNQRLNKFGNIPGRRKGLVKNKRQFIETRNGITGVWERGQYKQGKFSSKAGRQDTAMKLITVFKSVVNYKPRFPFVKIVEGIVKNKFAKHFDKRLRRAIAC